ncbi:hypothetical protein [Streptomyces albidoflavus]|uniref:hypothetical protein n=1 Tax=Streptomyces albidoflavus TaxID=1886 RepID=UPI0033C6DEFF
MSTQFLPHDPYIVAVVDALTAAGLEPDDWWASDAETDPYEDGPDAGCTTMLSAVLRWDADEDADKDGLFLFWDHPAEQWQYAWPRPEGGNTEPEFLPLLPRWAEPAAVADVARALLAGLPVPGGEGPQLWTGASAASEAVTRWGDS